MTRLSLFNSPLLLGFGTPGGNAHGPDEAMDLPGWADEQLVIGNYPPETNRVDIVLHPWEARVYRRTT